MKSDEEPKWHWTDYVIEEEPKEEPPPPGWLARYWRLLVVALLIGVAVTAWVWYRHVRLAGGDDPGKQISIREKGLIEAQLREILPPRQIGEDPTQRQLPAELVGKAKKLLVQGNDEQNALAKIALKNDSGADFILNILKREPIDQAFRLLTLEGHNWYNAGEFDRAVKSYEQALALRPEDAAALRNAAIAHSQSKQGDIAAHWKRAIELLTQAIGQVAPDSAQWCELQNNLGLAWMGATTGDKGENLGEAVAAFRSARNAFACEGNQVLWAKLQHNLGAAWLKMPSGDRIGSLHNAIAAFQLALGVYTMKDHPLEWANAQKGLGVALMGLADLHSGDASEELAQAAAIFRSLLDVLVREEHPLAWAEAQNNLGLVLDRLPGGDSGDNHRQAIAAFQAAEKAYSRSLHPMEWASTRFNQAVALKHLADGAAKGCDHLWQSMAYLKAAAGVWTPEAFPVPYQSQLTPFTQTVREAWRSRGCGTEATLDGIPAAK